MRGLAATICLPTRSTRSETSWVAGEACLNVAACVRAVLLNGLAETVVSFFSSDRQPATESIKPIIHTTKRAFMISLPSGFIVSRESINPGGGEGNDRWEFCPGVL